MKMHITNLYGTIGTHALAQRNVARIARELGFTEMGLYCYPIECDTKGELRKRLDGITSSVEAGDIVIFQSPSWNDAPYEQTLLDVIHANRNTRIAILIHDVRPLLAGDEVGESYQEVIDVYNKADLLIVPTENMLSFLREKGLTVKKIMIQYMFDIPFSEKLNLPDFRREILFSGSFKRFSFVQQWNYEIPMRLFSKDCFEIEGQNICFEGWKNTSQLLTEYTKGGFGLVWEEVPLPKYYKYNQPYKLSTYLAAGIPIIVQKGLAHEQTVIDKKLGFVAGSLEEAVDMVKGVSEEEYYQMINNVRNFSFLIREGYFTKKLLLDAVSYLMLS